MNSEKYINTDYSQYSHRKKRKKKKSKLPLILFFIILAVSMTFILRNNFSSLSQPYKSSITLSLISSPAEETAENIETFASDLCVVSDNTKNDGNYIPEAGIVCGVSGGDVIFAKNPFERLYPASTTKMMTAILALKYGNLDDMVTVPQDAVITESGASMAGVNPGDKLTLEQLLYGLLLPSGNDAANAIAVHIAGSTDAFADMMNEEAGRIGATDTHFVNANGLSDENHYTTAYDLYLILHEALKYPEFTKISSTAVYSANYTGNDGVPKVKNWENGNQYINGKVQEPDDFKPIGGKTGTTKAAGSCLALASEGNSGQYISIVMKAETKNDLYAAMNMLIEKIGS